MGVAKKLDGFEDGFDWLRSCVCHPFPSNSSSISCTKPSKPVEPLRFFAPKRPTLGAFLCFRPPSWPARPPTARPRCNKPPTSRPTARGTWATRSEGDRWIESVVGQKVLGCFDLGVWGGRFLFCFLFGVGRFPVCLLGSVVSFFW